MSEAQRAVSHERAQRADNPPEVIQRFINQSWRFIDAYSNGLTGWAAAWVVRKQKGHWRVSEEAMNALEKMKA
jgi:hypothetical protein